MDDIVPEIIAHAPQEVLEISYPCGSKVNQGKKLKPRQVKDIPAVNWNAEPAAYYTLCMIDPDAPSRQDPKFRSWNHWLVGNIPGNDIKHGETIAEYIGSGPPKGSGFHRYIFLIYKHDGKIDFHEKKLKNNSGKDRGKFSVKKFAEKYHLGEPMAGNYFQADWDDYVPELYRQLRA